MKKRKEILFIQLPLLDNDPKGESENHRLAAVYLKHSIEQSGENRYYAAAITDPVLDYLDNHHLVNAIIKRRPYALAATVTVWNVDRTLNILRAVRKLLPDIIILAGGPEVAADHPFLFKSHIIDIAVCGEGEAVLPSVLSALRRGRRTNYRNVGWRDGGAHRWGNKPQPHIDMENTLLPAAHEMNKPDSRGIASMETTRGCRAKCAFCCYGQQRASISWLPVPNVLQRVRILRRRGAREIRFIDPTFNSHPDFVRLLKGIARLNKNHDIVFFAEIKADSITATVANLLAQANVKQIEIGIQSTDPEVLRTIGRASNTEQVMRGIHLLAEHGINTTLDVMCGLPKQTLDDVKNTIKQLVRVPGGNVQLLHTLLIPGSDLRRKPTQYGLVSQTRPPYRVLSTPTMNCDDMLSADEFLVKLSKARQDSPAQRFVGRNLPDLFEEKINIDLNNAKNTRRIQGDKNRRAVLLRDDDLFVKRDAVAAVIRTALRTEPDITWQFVLCPSHEEPLDLVDMMADVIDEFPEHFLDRLHVRKDRKHRVARRVFIKLRRRYGYDPEWVSEIESLLSDLFY